nr:hypothetical protein [Aeromonas sp. sif2433]
MNGMIFARGWLFWPEPLLIGSTMAGLGKALGLMVAMISNAALKVWPQSTLRH